MSHDRLFDLQDTCWLMRLYADAERHLERAIQIAPDEPDALLSKVSLYIRWEGDTARAATVAREALAQLGFQKLGVGPGIPAFLIAGDAALRRGLDQQSPST